jgi:hypothetical protein
MILGVIVLISATLQSALMELRLEMTRAMQSLGSKHFAARHGIIIKRHMAGQVTSCRPMEPSIKE